MRARIAVFAMTAAALLGLALLLARGGEQASTARKAGDTAQAPPSLHIGVLSAAERAGARAALSAAAAADEGEPAATAPRTPEIGAVKAAARHFLGLFGRYEVNELSRRLRFEFRRSCTPAFAAELLSASPRPIRESPREAAPARAIAVELTRPLEGRALVTGVVRRGSRDEPFSFRFERTRSGWRAAGVGG